MLNTFQDFRAEILETAAKKIVRIAIIDPGTNCAIRKLKLRNAVQLNQYEWTFESKCDNQVFFHGDRTGENYVERMAAMAKQFKTDEFLKICDYYLIEGQFEGNVIISLGVLIGMISSIRSDDVVMYTKRTGIDAVKTMPYRVLTLNTRIKAMAFKLLGNLKPKKKEIKESALEAALIIAKDDEITMALLAGKKYDDVADVVCYEYGIKQCLHDVRLMVK